MPLQIQLDGLICHVGDDADHKTMAVLVDERDHKPAIFIDKAFRTDDPTKDINEKLKKGDLVEFSGNDLPAGPASTTTAFKILTPGLQQFLEDPTPANNDIDPKVKTKDKDQKIALVYVTYPGGKLDAIDEVTDRLKFTFSTGTTQEQYVADEALVTSTNMQGVTVTVTRRNGGNPLTATLMANSIVRITNRARINSFHTYRDLTLAGKMAVATKGSPCIHEAAPEGSPAAKSASLRSERRAKKFTGGPDDPACTNSQWP